MISFKWLIRYVLIGCSGLLFAFMIATQLIPSVKSETNASNSPEGSNQSKDLSIDQPTQSKNINESSKLNSDLNEKSGSGHPSSKEDELANEILTRQPAQQENQNQTQATQQIPQQLPNQINPQLQQSTQPVENKDSLIEETFKYDPTVGRDPFQPYRILKIAPDSVNVKIKQLNSQPLEPLQLVDLDKLSLVGIIWDSKTPRAMLVNRALDNKAYIIKQNSKVGRNNGIVKVIREGEVIIVESEQIEGNTIYTTKVLELSR